MKVPLTPPAAFVTDPSHLRDYSGALWRVYRTGGRHPGAWDTLRHHGPVPGMRFDPHPPPEGDHPSVGVLYAATEAVTALGETYQRRRVIDRVQSAPRLVGWRPARPLTLLDLTGEWPVRNGAAAAIQMGAKRATQPWARAIEERLRDVDGLWHLSAVTGTPLVTLFSRAERVPAFPRRPSFHTALDDVTADPVVLHAAQRLGFAVLGGV
ncbi:RES family NAD+ phosphorylase [Rathayibacter sp. VKM Ac-2760]|uniref:RES family NAD+ phosphorylase n=1 Tax=Rathayibacter sp. VKM Ac-2760 TaxID=2609253 RepID=UPI001316B460|nr:RES family NAD+ phosphorylase [Rathayibacter sp. VKM Ac-2760]QHC58829.1 RES domain-containing protein [Rathayibacter sp. VKM Ac-2760]